MFVFCVIQSCLAQVTMFVSNLSASLVELSADSQKCLLHNMAQIYTPHSKRVNYDQCATLSPDSI